MQISIWLYGALYLEQLVLQDNVAQVPAIDHS
jgi:hypothetical protein